MEDYIQDKGRAFRVDGDALRTIECPGHIHTTNEQILKPFIGKFVVVYFDNILIYNHSVKDHMDHKEVVGDPL
jgi:hypothetical protein